MEKREFSRFEAWVDLIQLATFQENNTQLIKGKLCTCNKGQTVASVRFLKERWSWNSLGKVLAFLELLRTQQMISIDKVNGINRISLTNYEKHNSIATEGNEEYKTKKNSKTRMNKGIQEYRDTENSTQTETESEQGKNIPGTNIKKENNENKGEDSGVKHTHPHTTGELESFQKFQQWIITNAPAVAEMEEPFTIGQYLQAAKKYRSDDIMLVLAQMHNWRHLKSKNRSAYYTLMNWKRREDLKSV